MEPQLFKISQSAVIQNSEGAILILRHKSGKWLLPGGKINQGETSLDGLKREIMEETGINDFKVKKVVDFEAWSEGDSGKSVATFLLNVDGVGDIVLSEEHDKYEWVLLENLSKYEFWHPSILERINKALII